MNGKVRIEIVLKLLENHSSAGILKSSLNILNITKKNRFQRLIFCIVAIIPSLLMGVSTSTQEILINSMQLVLEVMLAMFGIVFTGYAFFQALINDEILIRMIESTNNDENTGEEKSKLQETNESFAHCMMLILIAIIGTLFLLMIVYCMPNDFLLFRELVLNNSLATVLIFCYFYYMVVVMWEMKSFVFNIFQLFNLYAGTRILGLIESNEDDEK